MNSTAAVLVLAFFTSACQVKTQQSSAQPTPRVTVARPDLEAGKKVDEALIRTGQILACEDSIAALTPYKGTKQIRHFFVENNEVPALPIWKAALGLADDKIIFEQYQKGDYLVVVAEDKDAKPLEAHVTYAGSGCGIFRVLRK